MKDVSAEIARAEPDEGLAVLVMLLRFHGVGADGDQIRHRCGGAAVGAAEMLRCAKQFGLKARALGTAWRRLEKTPLPAIAGLPMLRSLCPAGAE
jgi:ATP-binding cassette, subfamily B, bacterial HlyB/CyaB